MLQYVAKKRKYCGLFKCIAVCVAACVAVRCKKESSAVCRSVLHCVLQRVLQCVAKKGEYCDLLKSIPVGVAACVAVRCKKKKNLSIHVHRIPRHKRLPVVRDLVSPFRRFTIKKKERRGKKRGMRRGSREQNDTEHTNQSE